VVEVLIWVSGSELEKTTATPITKTRKGENTKEEGGYIEKPGFFFVLSW